MKTSKKLLSLALTIIMIIFTVPLGVSARDCNHNYISIISDEYILIPATCVYPAVYTKSCKICGTPKIPEDVDPTDKNAVIGEDDIFYTTALGHDLKKIADRIEPTCTMPGYTEVYECQRDACDWIEGQIIPSLGHNYETIQYYRAPTCTTSGQYGIKKCTRCIDTLTLNQYGHVVPSSSPLPALGHIDNDFDDICDRCYIILAYTEGCYRYIVKDNQATIISVDNTIRGDIIIPSTLGGYPVVAIGDEAFFGCFYITSVTIPEGVTSIGYLAFEQCVQLKNILLPETLETIESHAFYLCFSLKEIVIPHNVSKIGLLTFFNCLSLEKLVIKNPETFIDRYIVATMFVPKDITNEEWVDKFLAISEAYLNGAENADALEEDFFLHTEEYVEATTSLPNLTIYADEISSAKTYAESDNIPFKTIDEYIEENHTCTFGEWYTVTEATVFAQGEKRRDCECGEYETDVIAKLENAVTKDETTNVEITYTDSNFDKAVEVTVSEEAINANVVFEDEYQNYKAYDISLVIDGEKVQPNGKVTVKLPVPENYNAESIAVYYVDNKGNKTLLDSTVQNGYVIFETDHFSEYVIVDESSKIETPIEPDEPEVPDEPDTPDVPDEPSDPTKDCSCNCHKGGIVGFFWKILNFFNKIFKKNAICACGVAHY